MNKLYIIGGLLYCITLHNIITPKAYAPDVYTAVALPKEFVLSDMSNNISFEYRALNDKGTVIGCIAPKKEDVYLHGKKDDPYEDAKAAYWTADIGVTTIDLSSYKSCSYAINDSNFITGTFYKDKSDATTKKERSFLWDTTNKLVKIGPMGHTFGINEKNEVLLNGAVWDSKDNTVQFIEKITFSDSWKPNVSRSHNGYFNKKLNAVSVKSHDIYLSIDGKNKLLSPPQEMIKDDKQSDVYLNDNDEVIALTYILSPTEKVLGQDKKIFSITKWRKDGLPATSDPISNIPELNDYLYDMELKGFNNKGQVLLLAKQSGNSNVNCMLFLLTLRT